MEVDFVPTDASTRLSEQVEELSRARRDHEIATANVEATLSELESKLEKARDANKVLVDKKNKMITQMCVKECEKEETNLRVNLLRNELTEALGEGVKLSNQIRLYEEEVTESQKTCEKYTQRMNTYKVSVEQHDQSLPEMKEVESAREKLKSLREEKKTLQKEIKLSLREKQWEEAMDDIRQEIKTLESSFQEKDFLAKKARRELQNKQQERKRLETSNKILKNRNSALLIRLRKQVESQRRAHAHLSSHVEMTATRLAASKARLEKLMEQLE